MKMIWFILVMAFTVSLNAMTTLSLNGATIGVDSQHDQLIWHNVSKLSSDELTELCWNYFQQHLKPIAEFRALTYAEYRMLLLCMFSEICNASALQTELFCMYNRDEKAYGCGAPLLRWYPVDKERLERMKDLYASQQYRSSDRYKRYVQGMKSMIYDSLDEADVYITKVESTPADYDLIKTILTQVASKDGAIGFYEFEFEVPKRNNAALWLSGCYFFYLAKSDFSEKWIELRRYYNQVITRLNSYKTTLTKQGDMTINIEEKLGRQKIGEDWYKMIVNVRKRLHYCVYDAPYVLLVTSFNAVFCAMEERTITTLAVLEKAKAWFWRSNRRVSAIKDLFITYSRVIGDYDDFVINLSTNAAVMQTDRLIELLKLLLGSGYYNSLREQSKLLKQMEHVAQGEWEE